jgi:hypothetical protein
MQELRAQIQAQIKLAATLRQVADQVKNIIVKLFWQFYVYFGIFHAHFSLFWPTLLVFWQFHVAHLMPILAFLSLFWIFGFYIIILVILCLLWDILFPFPKA